MRLTVISHFYNEELLLPYWLKHHAMVFDHGILIDYQSTDRSLEIIKQLTPNWEIRPSRNQNFDPYDLDAEVMDIEQEIKGWKCVLNTTEFLIHGNLKQAIQEVEYRIPDCVGIMPAGIIMCDTQREYNQPLNNEHLCLQRSSGWLEPAPPHGSRHRLIHRANDGHYTVGRHATFLKNVVYRDDIFCVWWGWSPYPQVKHRKLQIQTRMPNTGDKTLGKEHRLTSESMDELFWEQSQKTKNLFKECPNYLEQLTRLLGANND